MAAEEQTTTLTARLPLALKDDLDALARFTVRSRNALIRDALRGFIAAQRTHIAEIEAGILEADAGLFVSEEDMARMWAEFGLKPDAAQDGAG